MFLCSSLGVLGDTSTSLLYTASRASSLLDQVLEYAPATCNKVKKKKLLCPKARDIYRQYSLWVFLIYSVRSPWLWTLTLDQHNLTSSSTSLWMLMPHLKKFCQGVTAISCSREWDKETARKQCDCYSDTKPLNSALYKYHKAACRCHYWWSWKEQLQELKDLRHYLALSAMFPLLFRTRLSPYASIGSPASLWAFSASGSGSALSSGLGGLPWVSGWGECSSAGLWTASTGQSFLWRVGSGLSSWGTLITCHE